MSFILSTLQSIGFNWHIAIANFVNFLIILFILNKFVFKKVFNNIESRQNLIKEGLENSSLAETKLTKAIEDAENIISDSRKLAESNYKEIVDRAEVQAVDIRNSASFEINNLKSELNTKIKNAQESVESDFEKMAPSLLAKLLKKTLSNIDEATHDRIISSMIK